MSKEIIFVFVLFLSFEPGSAQNVQCPPLKFDGIVTCGAKNQDCTESQSIGTIAKYKCKPFYILRESDSIRRIDKEKFEKSEGELKCGADGRWIGHAKFKLAVCQEDCGRRLTNPKPLIINGVPTKPTNWPWHVALFRRTKTSGLAYICGGTIISRSTILTVAHCVTNQKGENLLPNSTVVVLGAFSSNFDQNLGRSETQIIMVKKIYVSENYDVKKEFQADIAVLHLSKNIEYTDYVSPICLPNDFTVDTNAITPGSTADVVGFGVDESGAISPSLKHGNLEIKSHSECFVTLERILSESQFCAGSLRQGNRVTVCYGDSGGGLYRASIIDQKYYIHGLVSTGEPSRKRGPCQTHAVFTRVYSFIIFIRDILNEIKDSSVLKLASDTAFPYKQAGTEEERVRFLTITQEWKNKVTAIDLSYVDIDPDILLQSLEYSKTVQSINFTNVKFTQLIPTSRRPQILPLLKTFSMDVLTDDFGRLAGERRFPVTISKEFLRSYIFFEKEFPEDFSGNSDITERIASLQTNIDLIVHIFKLLKIDHDQGTVVLSQIPFSTQILAKLPPDFQLRHLALSRVSMECCDSLSPNNVKNIETLILDQVTGFKAQDLSQIFQILAKLKEFVFIPPKLSSVSKFEISASVIPKSLKHMALTNTNLVLDGAGRSRPTRMKRQSLIAFPSHTPSKSSIPLSASSNSNIQGKIAVGDSNRDLETFYCDSCIPNLNSNFANWMKALNNVYPKLRKLVLKFDESVPITILAFEHFTNLEFVIINLSGYVQLFNKRNGRWYMKSMKNSHGFDRLEYVFNRKDNFWSSEADYTVGTRLKSYEKSSFKTGMYRFSGGYETRRRITPIPKQIQNRLHTVEILNTAMSRQTFLDSFESANEIKILRLINVSFTDYFISDLHFPNLIEYRFDVQIIPQFNFFSLKRLSTLATLLHRTYFLFEEDQPGFDVKVNFLTSKVRKYDVTYATCVILSWDANEGNLISAIAYTNQWLKHVKESSPVKKLSFEFWELDPTSVPSTVSHLNLNFAIVKNTGSMLKRLSGLRDLRLINVRVKDDGNLNEWEWIQIDMEDLSIHSNTLEYLALEKVHLRNYSPSMNFPKVKFLYLESCTFEKSFVRNFMATFPNIKRLVILGGSDPRLQIYLDVIILTALRSQTVEWILMSHPVAGSSTNRARNEINIILGRIGINNNNKDHSKYFILERTSSSVAWKRNTSLLDESRIEFELLVMKGVTDFGTYSQCHATTYKQGGWRGFVEDLFGGLLDIPKLAGY